MCSLNRMPGSVLAKKDASVALRGRPEPSAASISGIAPPGRLIRIYGYRAASRFRFKEFLSAMTSEQADLIRKSFDALWPVRRRLADVFYGRFFELAPDARQLFPDDMERQQLKLMDMIAAIVGALDKREIFQSIISYSGRQHAQFGVKRSHFAAFGDALIWGLEQQLGPAFTPELKQSWITLYDAVQKEMMRAAQI
jgi:hemoglobin-like flavoprotein